MGPELARYVSSLKRSAWGYVTFQSAMGIQVWDQLANFEAVKLSPKKSYNTRTPKNIFLKNSEKIKIHKPTPRWWVQNFLSRKILKNQTTNHLLFSAFFISCFDSIFTQMHNLSDLGRVKPEAKFIP